MDDKKKDEQTAKNIARYVDVFDLITSAVEKKFRSQISSNEERAEITKTIFTQFYTDQNSLMHAENQLTQIETLKPRY